MERKYDIIWHQCLDSTNSEAQKRLAELDNLTVIAAKCQFAGRGQRGNTWHSRQGENLTFSIVLKFQNKIDSDLISDTIDGLDSDVIVDVGRASDVCDYVGSKDVISIKNISFQAKNQHFISMALAIAVTEYLRCEHSLAAKIKWPNDIYCGDRKICGILIENSVKGSVLSSCIAGVGLNLNQTSFPADLPNPTSVRLELIRNSPERAAQTSVKLELISSSPDQTSSPASLPVPDSDELDYLTELPNLGKKERECDCGDEKGNNWICKYENEIEEKKNGGYENDFSGDGGCDCGNKINKVEGCNYKNGIRGNEECDCGDEKGKKGRNELRYNDVVKYGFENEDCRKGYEGKKDREMNSGEIRGEECQDSGLEIQLEKFIEHFDRQLSRVLAGDFDTLTNDYLIRMYRRGEAHEFVRTATGEHFTGTIIGITPDFRLLLSVTPITPSADSPSSPTSLSPDSSAAPTSVSIDSPTQPTTVSPAVLSAPLSAEQFSFKEIDYII